MYNKKHHHDNSLRQAVQNLLPLWAVSCAPDTEHVQIKLMISPSPHHPQACSSFNVPDLIKWRC